MALSDVDLAVLRGVFEPLLSDRALFAAVRAYQSARQSSGQMAPMDPDVFMTWRIAPRSGDGGG
jgi:hypothetical protein